MVCGYPMPPSGAAAAAQAHRGFTYFYVCLCSCSALQDSTDTVLTTTASSTAACTAWQLHGWGTVTLQPSPAAPEDWVRVKHGLYKGDLAKVLDLDYSRDRATIQIVPRLDYAAMAKRQQEGGRAPPFGGVQPGKARPPQR